MTVIWGADRQKLAPWPLERSTDSDRRRSTNSIDIDIVCGGVERRSVRCGAIGRDIVQSCGGEKGLFPFASSLELGHHRDRFGCTRLAFDVQTVLSGSEGRARLFVHANESSVCISHQSSSSESTRSRPGPVEKVTSLDAGRIENCQSAAQQAQTGRLKPNLVKSI